MRGKIWMLLVAVWLLTAMPALANPFMAGRPSEMGAASQSLMTTPYMHEILDIQRGIHEALTQKVVALKEGQSLAALWGLLVLGLVYGVFHVLAPGHSKMIVASYFLGNQARWGDGIWAGLVMAVGHTVTAVAFVVALNLVLGLTQFGVVDKARYGELFGYGLITLIGGRLLWRSLRRGGRDVCGCGHEDRQHHHGHMHLHGHGHGILRNRKAVGLFAATSLVPCTGSMIILLFTLANDVLWAGVLAVVAIAAGMWVTVTLIGTVAIFMRRMVLRDETAPGNWQNLALRTINVLAAVVVLATGGLLFLGTLYEMTG